ncbi:hypothetical protein OGAPHI_007033 [Ogataea philodendri]|uniref:Exocyst complex subunit Exo70 C-terminal domain-containing protein n=1 Tax=Ogataea philodendri TaxID=1378263 RepID=A0A9P8NWF0_9ASCO|nr:uncharacterized protein OGAPHI_007033 [Ogataea philodendri]KAH3660447.1 hypothetical protein OGAPHI_007033 [Ogataea philodendri]
MSLNGPMKTVADAKVSIDVDEADMSVLEESLSLTQELTNALSAKLYAVSTSNASAIKSINPLMTKINRLKLQQKNFQDTFKLVESIKDYAQDISKLDKSIKTFGSLQSAPQITNYCQIIDKYQSIQSDLESRKLNDFEGLKKGLDNSIRDAEVTLKFEFINGLKLLSKRLKNNDNTYTQDENDIISRLKIIYGYMKRSRNKNLLDTLIKERADFNLSTLRSLNLDPPALVKDQTYYYDGDKHDKYFIKFAKTLQSLLYGEPHFLSKFFDDFNQVNQLLFEVLSSSLELFVKQFNSLSSFVEIHKSSYNSMYFEIDHGLSLVLGAFKRLSLLIPRQIEDLEAVSLSQCQSVFSEMFKYIDQRYSDMVVGESVNETLNNTFMSLISRTNKFSVFHEYQLKAIAKMSNGSWLPQSKPPGFQEIKGASSDPSYLLSVFYGDVIEYNLLQLERKYRSKMNDEDLGILLLFNLDGLQNLLDNSGQLKQVLGRNGLQRLDKLKKKSMEKATVEWTRMTTKLMQASTRQGDSFNLSPKELGKLIDEFNKTFEENFKKMQNKKLPPFFKKQLNQDINKMLVPAYRVFYTNFTNGSSKSVAKHFKYDINGLQNKIASLG